jgi:hypothetical protein
MLHFQQYDKEKFLNEFSQTEVFKKISSDYKYLFSDKTDIPVAILEKNDIPPPTTPRSRVAARSIFLYSIFYYLNFLTELDPKTIADIGCGGNFLKKYIPSIVGIDNTLESDVFSYFDDHFLENNFQKFDCALAINSIHFISLKDFSKRINDFGKIIKPGGRAFVTFSLRRMIEHTEPHEFAEIFPDLSRRILVKDYCDFLEEEIKKVNYKIIVRDFIFAAEYCHRQQKEYDLIKGSDWPPFEHAFNRNYTGVPDHIVEEINLAIFNKLPEHLDEGYNGNIRLVFEVM